MIQMYLVYFILIKNIKPTFTLQSFYKEPEIFLCPPVHRFLLSVSLVMHGPQFPIWVSLILEKEKLRNPCEIIRAQSPSISLCPLSRPVTYSSFIYTLLGSNIFSRVLYCLPNTFNLGFMETILF